MGFRFLVQGDFELVASRQAVHQNRPWNAWLRSEIAHAFIDATAAIPGLRSRFFRFVPTESDVPDAFWREVVTQLTDLLRNEACIETEGGAMRKPSEVWLRPAGLSPAVLSSAELEAASGRAFVSERVEVAQAKRLRCAELPDVEFVRTLLKVRSHR